MRSYAKKRYTAALLIFALILSVITPTRIFANDISISHRDLSIKGSSVEFMLDIISLVPGVTVTQVQVYLKEIDTNKVTSQYLTTQQSQQVRLTTTPGLKYGVEVYVSYTITGGASFTVQHQFQFDSSIAVTFSSLTVSPASDENVVIAAIVYNSPATLAIEGSGFIYSPSTADPTTATSDVVVKPNMTGSLDAANMALLLQSLNITSLGNEGIIGAYLDGLASTQTYYVRGYIAYNDGTGTKYIYSDTLAYTHANPGAPVVQTVSAERVGNSINVRGSIISAGKSEIIDYGFVYSFTNADPKLSNSQFERLSGSYQTNFSFSMPTEATSGTLYIRAYAKNASDTSHGTTIAVDLSQAGAPRVNLKETVYIGANSAQFVIEVPQQDLGAVIERGVVYSKDPIKVPAIDGGPGHTSINADKATGKPAIGEVTIEIDNLERNTKYYIRAYLKTHAGTFYSSDPVLSFTTKAEENVITYAVSDITNTSVTLSGLASDSDSFKIQEKGFVYSPVNNPPEFDNSSTVVDEVKAQGEFSAQVTNLAPNTKYYVRAYVIMNGERIYGQTRSFTTLNNTYLKIDEVINKGTSASIKATVFGLDGTIITERGVVYSDVFSSPNIENSGFVKSNIGGLGAFEVEITELAAGKPHYVRAYARDNSGSVYYSTAEELAAVTSSQVEIEYRLGNGITVGTGALEVGIGSVVTAANLNPPTGYLVPLEFSYMVYDMSPIIVTVIPDPAIERQYVKGTGNYRFEPDIPMKRIDVILMIYNILGEGKEYLSPITFPDMPSDSEMRNAVNFVTSQKIVVGFDDGYLYPEDSVTRAQIVVMINNAFKFRHDNSIAPDLIDISDHWALPQIIISVQNKYISGYPDKTFRPDQPVSRAEAVTMMCFAAKREGKPLGTAEFTDVPADKWYYPYIMNASIPEP